MSETITLHGHPISKGVAEGEALVCDKPMSFIAVGVSNETGIVSIGGHPLEGQSVAGKVLIYDTDIFSTGGALSLYAKKTIFNSAPAAVIWRSAHNIGAGGTIYAEIPSMDRIEEGLPWDLISTGDWVKVDSNQGTVEVTKKS